MSLVAGYMPHLPPTPKPIGGPIPDRSVRKEMPPMPVGFHGREPNREKRREAIRRRRAES